MTPSPKQRIKRRLRGPLCRAALASGWVAARRRNQNGRAIVLTYHRVLPPDDPRLPLSQPGMVVTAPSFAMQMEHVRRHYRTLDLGGFVSGLSGGFAIDRPSCLVTFDDGWLDNIHHALPVLKRLGIPGVVFLATDYVGTNRTFWSDTAARLLARFHALGPTAPAPTLPPDTPEALAALLATSQRAVRSLSDLREGVIAQLKATGDTARDAVLAALAESVGESVQTDRQIIDWDEVAEMMRAGIVPGGHTRSHPILTEIDRDRQRAEITGSFEAIQQHTGYAPRAFCYPNGNLDETIVQTVRDAGYETAFTCGTGGVRSEADPFRIPRYSTHEDISSTEGAFACWITGVFA